MVARFSETWRMDRTDEEQTGQGGQRQEGRLQCQVQPRKYESEVVLQERCKSIFSMFWLSFNRTSTKDDICSTSDNYLG